MEDLKAYIESGILELYVLGELSPDEMRTIERMAEQSPEVKHELQEIEKAMYSYSQANEIEPSDILKKRILNSLATDLIENLPVKTIEASSHLYKYAFAASVALLFISTAVIVNLNSKLNDSYNQIAVLQISNQKFSNRVNYIDKKLKHTQKSLEVYKNPSEYKMVKLQGTAKVPAASIMVAFNPNKEEVMIDLSSMKMPVNDLNHQYQLWALVDGKPVDLGVFDAYDTSGMKQMKSIKNAQAFAVTLEPKGGSKAPTMEQMMAMGSI